MEEDETPEDEIPKTQTESSGGGSPPGKTRVGGGAERRDWDDFSFLHSKRRLGSLVLEARKVIIALERELEKKEKGDAQEILLLQNLFEMVLQEINTHSSRRSSEASEDLTRLIKLLEKRFPTNTKKET